MIFEKTILSNVLSNAFDIPVEVTYWDGKTEKYGNGEPQVKVNIKQKFSLGELATFPTLVLAEAYMRGDIEIDGSIQKLVASAYRKPNSFLTDQSGFGKSLIKLFGNHSQKQSKEDIHKHYDIGNEFYKKWLDSTMTYSCAYFERDDMTLEEAQYAKVYHILDKLNSQPGKRLLDIGCGWGTLIFTAAQEYGLEAVGVTLSERQFNYVTEQIKERGLLDKVRVYLLDYRDLKEGEFDYITSVGMFEHVGKENLQMYFQKVADYLKPNGRALIHGITSQQRGAGVDPFIVKYIFPGGYIPFLAENMEHILNAKLQIDDVEPLRRHYQRTLEMWNENYMKVFDEVKEEMGIEFARMWTLYLQSCAASFESGNMDVVQYLMTKGASGQGLPMTRDYMLRKHSSK